MGAKRFLMFRKQSCIAKLKQSSYDITKNETLPLFLISFSCTRINSRTKLRAEMQFLKYFTQF